MVQQQAASKTFANNVLLCNPQNSNFLAGSEHFLGSGSMQAPMVG